MKADKIEFNQKIGAVLRQKRKNIGWSREQLRRKSGISFSELFCYESGRHRITLMTFLHLCRLLDMSFRDKSTRLSPEEQQWLAAYRNRDYGVVLDWLRSEVAGELPQSNQNDTDRNQADSCRRQG